MTAKSKSPAIPVKRSRTSSVSYPYHPLALCVDLAKGVRDIGNGKQDVPRSLLASHLKVGENSGDFITKIASAKTYGLIDGRGTFNLTDLSRGYFFPTTDPDREKKMALLQASAQPGAFSALLSRFDGSKPPDQELIGNVLSQQMGIPESWKARVTKYFLKSMEFAGALGSDGFLRHAAELERVRRGGPPLKVALEKNGQDQNGGVKDPLDDPPADPPNDPDQVGVIVWKYPYKGKTLRVETPEDMPKEVWQKLSAYIGVLEPTE